MALVPAVVCVALVATMPAMVFVALVRLAIRVLFVVRVSTVALVFLVSFVTHVPFVPFVPFAISIVRVIGHRGLLRPFAGVGPVMGSVEQERSGIVEGGNHRSGRGDADAHPRAGHLLPEAVRQIRQLRARRTTHDEHVPLSRTTGYPPPATE
ncbi:hypothetical protein [Dietzia cercidiphylli]|jgi:hypothetical protein|uniref:hypothetical protein n=1 Tax=Dietzia cercidiphylli TaxID=498199 RepID=UPI00223AD9D0|nr:hypothetical protein [Dietzia cercidiphylli]MCT1516301.1 hypothetical protein [Dietzia cercidiphylli]